jgi:hypothetical protein
MGPQKFFIHSSLPLFFFVVCNVFYVVIIIRSSLGIRLSLIGNNGVWDLLYCFARLLILGFFRVIVFKFQTWPQE